jgi:hypothetical protein
VYTPLERFSTEDQRPAADEQAERLVIQRDAVHSGNVIVPPRFASVTKLPTRTRDRHSREATTAA